MRVQEAHLPEAELWRRAQDDGVAAVTEHLVALYAPWVGAVARSVYRRVGAYQVDYEDFVQNARVGLLEAIARYDPARGVAFQAFAGRRVRGAVFNGLRAILADRMSPAQERYQERLESLQDEQDDAFGEVVRSIVGLGLGYLLEEAGAASLQRAAVDASCYSQSLQLEERLHAAVRRLPDRLRELVQAHYFRFIPFQDLATRWGVSKGRVSQLHRSALDRLALELRDLR